MPPASAIAGSTTSRIRRRRARTKPITERLRFAPASSRCGENLRTVSAIARLPVGLLGGLLALHGLAQVLFHGGEVREQRVHVGRLQPGERGLHQVLAELAQALE